MCGISGFELVVILAAAIIFLGPERLPDMMRTVGKVARELRKLRGDLGEVTREITRSSGVDDLKDQLKETLEVDRVRERVVGAESEIDAIRARLKRRVDIPTEGDAPSAASGGTPQIRPAAGAVANSEPLEAPSETLEAPGESLEAPQNPAPQQAPSTAKSIESPHPSTVNAPQPSSAPIPQTPIPAAPRSTVMPEEKLAAALRGEEPS